MRLSGDKKDKGHRYGPTAWGARIFFNGVEVRNVVTADEEEGFILQIVVDASGLAQLAPCGTEILTEKKYGKVRIELPT